MEKTCEIVAVKHGRSFRWKWRTLAAAGTARQSQETYELFYECVLAARSAGLDPQLRR
ncbi:MAG TPA: hypothetical protein VFB08_14540 [Burkholderiales bacterium]|nr:hypothetical protein [Burkholderiales bacterium]